ncbi:MAG: ABC transporter ATP-binding protein [Lachnospiraceae bacterium]|nr:ABC transporter ATP-binding protein [Lachnospiraceae bacterium]
MVTVSWIFTSVGTYGIFRKCGVKWYYCFIPFAREYHIGLCADREKEGRIYMVLSVLYDVLNVVNTFFGEGTVPNKVFSILILAIATGVAIYGIRVYLGLCRIFNRSKKWLFMWIFFEGITSVIWGFNKSFMPSKQVETIDRNAGAKVAGINAKVMDMGLTVNITERTAIDLFRKKILLKDIHLNIPLGHMVLLLGGSGAGKTTFVNAVTGYEKADAKILLNGKDLYADYGKMKYDIGFVPQQDLMRGNDTVALTLSDAASLRLPASVSYDERKGRIQDVLEEFGLASIKGSLVEKLSGGQRKRLSIAMEFISNPSLFILDEPDSGLDGVVARGLFEKLRAIADTGKIVIVITHTPDRVIDLFDDVIVLAKDASRTGRLAYYGPVKGSYEFFGKESMEGVLLSINQKDEGGEGKADEYVGKYSEKLKEKVG